MPQNQINVILIRQFDDKFYKILNFWLDKAKNNYYND